MQLRQIKEKKQFDRVAARMEMLIDAPTNTREALELKALTRLVIDYSLKEKAKSKKG